MTQSAMYSSASILWGTPPELFRMLNEIYDFQLDAASTDQNRLCRNHFTEADDGLSQDWHEFRRVWLNPPYGKTIGSWMRKAHEESQKGCLVVCLVPARVDTKWWHDWVLNKAHVIYPKGRLRYLNYATKDGERSGGAPFPSAIVIYGPDLELRKTFSTNLIERKSAVPILERKCIRPNSTIEPRDAVWLGAGRTDRSGVPSTWN